MGIFDHEHLLQNVISTIFQNMHCVWEHFMVEMTVMEIFGLIFMYLYSVFIIIIIILAKS